MKEAEAEIAKVKEEEAKITKEERYLKLMDLLKKSSFYSKYLKDKIEKSEDDDAAKKLKEKKIQERKKQDKTVTLLVGLSQVRRSIFIIFIFADKRPQKNGRRRSRILIQKGQKGVERSG